MATSPKERRLSAGDPLGGGVQELRMIWEAGSISEGHGTAAGWQI